LRHHRKGCSAVRAYGFWLLCALFGLLAEPVVAAQTGIGNTDYDVTGAPGSRVLHFTTIDTVRDNGTRLPTAGWQREPVGRVLRNAELSPNRLQMNAIWGRLAFDRAALDPGPLALLSDMNRDRIIIWLNGREVFRNFADRDPRISRNWYRPYAVRLPPDALRAGLNTLVIRAESDHEIGIGEVSIGPPPVIADQHAVLQFWRINATFAANAAMLLLSVIAIAGWAFRRLETSLLLIGLAGLIWFARNYHFFATDHPFNQVWFFHANTALSYTAPVMSAAFCLSFLGTPRRRVILMMFAIIGAVAWVANVAGLVTPMLVYVLAFLVGIATFLIVLFGSGKLRTTDHWALAFILAFVAVASLHDVTFGLPSVRGGFGFFLQPYFGLIFAMGFLASFGRRALAAFSAVTALNRTLEDRIAQARADLIDSEAKRRTLEVQSAVGIERERLMREMHDGIGSNLVVALAVAEKQGQPKSTITTLRRALSDLRITVDSLEPVDGDVVALLANFRHRLAPDLKRAGLTIVWRPEICPRLSWLDEGNALHLMRLFQEVVSNIVAHAGASQIIVSCRPEWQSDREGIGIHFADNGSGFDPDADQGAGKGLGNMQARAAALRGEISIASVIGKGTKIGIWLPLLR
jgi:signal transduction histidine kinase